MPPKLTKTQRGVLDTLAEHHQATLIRVSGGFWTYPTCPRKAGTIPTWWVDVRTVRAMERQGHLERTNEFPEEWRDTRRLKI
jgi:hypothetical protein